MERAERSAEESLDIRIPFSHGERPRTMKHVTSRREHAVEPVHPSNLPAGPRKLILTATAKEE